MTAELNEKLSELLSDEEMLEIRAQVKAEILAEMDAAKDHVRLELNETVLSIFNDGQYNKNRKTPTEFATAGIKAEAKKLAYSAREAARKAKDIAIRCGDTRAAEYCETRFQHADKLYNRL